MDRSALLTLILSAVFVLVVLEAVWVGLRRVEKRRQDSQWITTEKRVTAFLSDPERKSLVQDVVLRAEADRAKLEHICQLTAQSLRVPAAMISAVDSDGQTWLASFGAPWCHEYIQPGMTVTLGSSYCKYVVVSSEPLMIRDSMTDKRVASVDENARQLVRAYLGVPVRTNDSVVYGSLCVFDVKPRKWSQRDLSTVVSYASLVVL